MAEAKLNTDIQALKIILAILSGVLLVFWLPEFASLARVLDDANKSSPRIEAASGVIDYQWNRRRRSPEIALTDEGGIRIEFACPDRGFRRYWVCPDGSDAWNNHKGKVRWIDVPTGISGDVVHRIVDISGDALVEFHTTPQAVYAAEASASAFAVLVAFLIVSPIWLIFYGALSLVRGNQRS